VALSKGFSAEAFTPLLQLTALTHLQLTDVGAAAKGTVGVVAQLTGLKRLGMEGLPQLPDPTLLQLTALTALEELDMTAGYDSGDETDCTLMNEVRFQAVCIGSVWSCPTVCMDWITLGQDACLSICLSERCSLHFLLVLVTHACWRVAALAACGMLGLPASHHKHFLGSCRCCYTTTDAWCIGRVLGRATCHVS
jgi:hypothetical protein